MNYTITLNIKTIATITAALMLTAGGFLLGASLSDAASRNIKLLGDKDFNFYLFDNGEEVFVLPPTQGNDGDIFVFKANSNTTGILRSTESVDGAAPGVDYLVGGPQSLILVADAANGVWWSVSRDFGS